MLWRRKKRENKFLVAAAHEVKDEAAAVVQQWFGYSMDRERGARIKLAASADGGVGR